jgi:hypothetical protein
MPTEQPKWAWWIVGILVPVVAAVLPIALTQGHRATQSTGSSEVATKIDENVEASVESEKQRHTELTPDLRTGPTSSAAQSTAPDNHSTRTDSSTSPVAAKANVSQVPPRSPYTIRDGLPLHLQEIGLTISAQFSTLKKAEYVTLIAVPERAPAIRQAAYNSGISFTIKTEAATLRADVLSINWTQREVVITIVKTSGER